MDVSDFVEQALRQIIQGVAKAQAAETIGPHVNAAFPAGYAAGGNIIHAEDHGLFTRVDFDIAVSAETSGKAGAGLKVWGAGLEAGAEHTRGTANRITFSVPVRLPTGDQTLAKKIEEEDRAENARRRREAESRGGGWMAQ